ncbi:MAG: tetratricopeptide repeat protein [Deltaproteobacteria bacterium]|nr:tetratricopeptide repeat protein [Deltaproteobacteria bacterium]
MADEPRLRRVAATDDEEDQYGPVADMVTAEFVLPEPEEEEGPLVVATVFEPRTDVAHEARRLVLDAQRELAAADEAQQARLHLELGVIYEQQLHDQRRAIHHYQQAYRLAGENVASLRAARQVFAARQNWAMVLTLLDAELHLAGTPAALAQLQWQKGRIYEDWLGNGEAAIRCYVEALHADPGQPHALHRLRSLYWRRQDTKGLLEICRRAAAATRDPRQRSLLYNEVARLQEEELGQAEAAIETYAVALSEDPANASVRSALKRLYHQRQRWGDLVDVLLTEAELAPSGRERAMAYLGAARLCRDRLEQPDRALELLRRARLEAPDPLILQELVELLQQSGLHAELAEALPELIATLREDAERVSAHHQLGQLLEERLGREEDALLHYRRAAALDPAYVPALQSLGRLYQRRGAWAELAGMYAAEAEAIQDPQARAARFCAVAELCEARLNDPRRAVELHRRALATVPHFGPAERALERLYSTTKDWAALLILLESRLERLPPADGAELLEQMARVCEERQGDPDRAIAYCRRALAARPGHGPLLQMLARLYAAAQRFDSLLEVLDQEIAQTSDPELRLALAHQAAETCETRLDRLDDAVARYQQILEWSAGHAPTLKSLGRIYHRRGNWVELVELFRSELDRGGLPADRMGLLLYKLGEIYEEQLLKDDEALAAYQQAVHHVPGFLPALQALARIHRRQGQWPRLVEVMQRKAAALSEPRHKATALYTIGEVWEARLGEKGQAAYCYRQALELSPDHEASREALLRLLVADGRYGEVAELYEQALRACGEERGRVSLLKQLGEVWDHRLLDPERAAGYYEQALAAEPDNLETLEALARLYRRLGHFERLAETYERLAAASRNVQDAVNYLYEAASVVEVRLQPERDPTALYERIVELGPDEGAALDVLAMRHQEAGDSAALRRVLEAQLAREKEPDLRRSILLRLAVVREEASDLAGAAEALSEAATLGEDWLVVRELRRLRERLEQWREATQSLEREAALSRDRTLALESLLRAASSYQERFGELDRAVAALQQVLTIDPFHEEAAGRLEQLLVQRGAWEQLVEVSRRRVEAVGSGARPTTGNATMLQIELIARMAWIQREHLHAPTEAVATLGRAVRLDPNHLPTLLTLGELHVGLDQWHEAVAVLSRIVTLSDDPELLRRAHYQLGDIWSEKLADHRQAISCYQNVLAIAPRDRRALGRLYELFVWSRDWENAAETLGRVIEIEPDADRQVEHYLALAEIHEKGFGDPQMAAEQLRNALAVAPTSERLISRLVDLHARLAQWETLSETLRAYLVALPEEQQQRNIGRRIQLAEILHQRFGRNAEALEQYRAVIAADGRNIEARLASARILAHEGRLPEAIAAHREVLALDPLNAESLRQLRTIWTRLGAHEQAHAAVTVLVCVGAATEPEERAYREHRARGVREPSGPVDDTLSEAKLVHPAESSAGRALLAVLGEVAHRLRPPPLEEWHIGRADRLPARSEDPLKALLREVGDRLGLAREVEVYVSPTRSRDMDLLLTDPPALVVGGGLMAALPSREVRFWMGVLLSYLRNRTWVAYGLDGGALDVLVKAACRSIDPTYPVDGAEEADVAEWARVIQRSLSRRGRRALEEACQDLLVGRRPNMAEWARAMQYTAVRTGLRMVNDLEAALSHLRRNDPRLPQGADAERQVWALQRNPLALELVRYWMSDEYRALRRAAEV